nr:hypothetical protein GCM10020185_88060 [Pseudomonas brassicacearum subsp. brassicacearum]
MWQEPYDQRPSVGVVTFNRKQADLIEEHLEQRAEQDELFRAAYTQERERSEDGEDMSVFVKNVENVQGGMNATSSSSPPPSVATAKAHSAAASVYWGRRVANDA